MGVGPVLIVFGSVNISKQTSYPSAAWLLVFIFSFHLFHRYEELSTVFNSFRLCFLHGLSLIQKESILERKKHCTFVLMRLRIDLSRDY